MVGESDNGVNAGFPGIGDPLFGAVEDVIIAVAHCRGLDGSASLPDLRFGEGKSASWSPRPVWANIVFWASEPYRRNGRRQEGGGIGGADANAGKPDSLQHQQLSKQSIPRPPYSSGTITRKDQPWPFPSSVRRENFVLIQLGPTGLMRSSATCRASLEKALLFGQQIVHALPLNLRIWDYSRPLYTPHAGGMMRQRGIRCIGGRRHLRQGDVVVRAPHVPFGSRCTMFW